MDIAYGTRIINNKTQEQGLLIRTWINNYADADVYFATCVDTKGRRYNIELDCITPVEDYYDS